jgi:hypothetical protein
MTWGNCCTGPTDFGNQKFSATCIGHKTPSESQPKPQTKPVPMSDWQELYECFLLLNAKRSTYRRYARALDRFFGMNRGKEYGYQFLRPVIIDYVNARLAEGASVSTVRLEISAVRGLFAYMMRIGAVDVMFNPARNVKVRRLKEPVRVIPVGHTSFETRRVILSTVFGMYWPQCWCASKAILHVPALQEQSAMVATPWLIPRCCLLLDPQFRSCCRWINYLFL